MAKNSISPDNISVILSLQVCASNIKCLQPMNLERFASGKICDKSIPPLLNMYKDKCPKKCFVEDFVVFGKINGT